MYRFLTQSKLNLKLLEKRPVYLLILLSIFFHSAYAFTEEELKWLESDNEEKSLSVNEGQLQFLTEKKKNILHSDNTISINSASIDTGWVSLKQCYRQLDKLPEVDITYQYRFMRQLTISSKKNIEEAVVNNQSISLKNIIDNAEICITAEVRIFYQNPDGSYSLVNGPYHRRFLDGYYPYHVSLKIFYPEQLLQLVKTIPPSQPGFRILQQHNQVSVDTIFEGRLNTEIIFTEHPEPN